MNEENDRPDVLFHLNIYEDLDDWPNPNGGPTDGLTPVDLQFNVTVDPEWDHSLGHKLIDDYFRVDIEVRSWIYRHLSR